MNLKLAVRSLGICLGAIHVSPSDLLAQQYMRPFTIELSASAGGTFDLPGATAFEGQFCQPGTTNCVQQLRLGKRFLPTLNGEIAVALNRFFWLYGDYSHVLPDRQSASAALDTRSGVNTVNRHYWMAMGGVELSFSTVHGIVPLLRIGAGNVYHNYNSTTVRTNVPSAPFVNLSEARDITAGTVGGGVRWYVRERQGIRVMANAFYLGRGVYDLVPAPFGTRGVSNVTRRSGGSVTVGYFIQFGR